jgi:ATPase family associated with various cellular activities (AAA)
LAGFQVGDQLPGEQRRREARTIFTQISDNSFRFGILSGDTGVGKSSLARAELTKILEAEGCKVHLLGSPRQVFSKSGTEDVLISAAIKAIRDWMTQKVTSNSGQEVIIIDQFEELFIQFRTVSDRQRIANLLKSLIANTSTKIICVIRHDYYLDFLDFDTEIDEPTSARNTFNLRNFEITEAAKVITECAGADGIAISDHAAERLQVTSPTRERLGLRNSK